MYFNSILWAVNFWTAVYIINILLKIYDQYVISNIPKYYNNKKYA